MEEKETKKQNKFVAFLKRVFVHNIGWKLLAIASAILIWVLAAGLWHAPREEKPDTESSAISVTVEAVGSYDK